MPEPGGPSHEFDPSEGGEESEKNSFVRLLERSREISSEMREAQEAESLKADLSHQVRERFSREGITLESLEQLFHALEMTNFEAFSAAELHQCANDLESYIIESDPAFKARLQKMRDALRQIARTKSESKEI